MTFENVTLTNNIADDNGGALHISEVRFYEFVFFYLNYFYNLEQRLNISK